MCINLLLMLMSLSILDGGVYDSVVVHSSWMILNPRWLAYGIWNEVEALCINRTCERIYIADM